MSLLFGHTLVTIGSVDVGFVKLDASLEERHVASAEVTDHPVEEGSDVADHVKQSPDELTVTGIVTNHPVVYLASLTEEAGRAETALENLRDIKEQGQPVDVITSLREYSSMVLTRVDTPRTAKIGDAIQVTLDFKRVNVVKSKAVAAPEPAQARGTPTAAAGKKPPTPADAAQTGASTSIAAGWAGL